MLFQSEASLLSDMYLRHKQQIKVIVSTSAQWPADSRYNKLSEVDIFVTTFTSFKIYICLTRLCIFLIDMA